MGTWRQSKCVSVKIVALESGKKFPIICRKAKNFRKSLFRYQNWAERHNHEFFRNCYRVIGCDKLFNLSVYLYHKRNRGSGKNYTRHSTRIKILLTLIGILNICFQLSHFTFDEANNIKFKLNYLVNVEHWIDEKGPILVYCGNEGDLTMFADNFVMIIIYNFF